MVQGSPGDPSGFSPLTPPTSFKLRMTVLHVANGDHPAGTRAWAICSRKSSSDAPSSPNLPTSVRETPKFLRASALDTLRLGIVEGRRQYRKPI